jgi:hypothetical protein
LEDKDSVSSHRLKVYAFLILERVAGTEQFRISVLLQADGQFIGKTSLGTAAEGQEILLSLSWDRPRQRFVLSSRAAGRLPILSFIPFASPVAADANLPPDFAMAKSFVLNSPRKNASEAHEKMN